MPYVVRLKYAYFFLYKCLTLKGVDLVPEAPTWVGFGEGKNQGKHFFRKICGEAASNSWPSNLVRQLSPLHQACPSYKCLTLSDWNCFFTQIFIQLRWDCQQLKPSLLAAPGHPMEFCKWFLPDVDTSQATIFESLLYGDIHHCVLADLETKK